MLPESAIAYLLVACLTIFFSLNFLNLAKTRRSKHEKTTKAYAEVEQPEGLFVGLAAFGTFLFFLESATYPFLVFTGLSPFIDAYPLQFHFQLDSFLQVIGIVLEITGYSLFLWSVLERGRYAVSWEMSENHKLVTWGPYRYVRHPSYLGYFLMFFGLPFMLLNLLALVPLIAIPGYVNLTAHEEELLLQRFGNEFIEYQKRTGRFLPKLSHS